MRSRVGLVCLVVGLLAGLAAAAPAAAAPRVCVYTQERNVLGGALTGHAFVQLLPDSGPDQGKRNLAWGFYPEKRALFLTGSPGLIADDAKHGWDWKLCNTLTTNQYNDAAKIVADDRKTTPEYVFLKFNCTDWAYKVGKAAGMKLPPAGALGTGVYDPERVAKEMEKLWREQGGRNIPGGNAVFKNSDHKTPEGSGDLRAAAAADIDAPFGDSYTDIVREAFADPSETADAYDFSSGTAQHDDATLDPGGELHVKLTGFDGDEAITALRWGDNEADYQGRVFSHTYKEAGTYRVTGVALAKQNVQRFAIVVHVSDGGDREARVDVEIPTGAAHVDRAPRLVEGPAVAQLPA